MITTNNETPSGSEYPCSFGGSITLEKIDSNSTEYQFECVGLTENPFTFWILKSIAGSTIDYEAVVYWLMEQVEAAAGGTNSSTLSMDIIFDLDSVSGGVATLDASGDYSCILNDMQNSKFHLTIEGIGDDSYDIVISVSDAGGNSSYPDPGDVFRWLTKQLKKHLCPECL